MIDMKRALAGLGGAVLAASVVTAPVAADPIKYYIPIAVEQQFLAGLGPSDWPRHLNGARADNKSVMGLGINACRTGKLPRGVSVRFLISANQSGLCKYVRINEDAARR